MEPYGVEGPGPRAVRRARGRVGWRRSAVVIDHSTTSPRGTRARIARVNRSGVKFLHAPVFMSPQMARDAVGIMLASGPQAAFDEVLDELGKMTGDVWYLGEQGDLAAASMDEAIAKGHGHEDLGAIAAELVN